MKVAAVVRHVVNGIEDKLARVVAGDVASPVSGNHLNPSCLVPLSWMEKVCWLKGSPQSHNGRVFDKNEGIWRSFLHLLADTKLNLPGCLVVHPAERMQACLHG